MNYNRYFAVLSRGIERSRTDRGPQLLTVLFALFLWTILLLLNGLASARTIDAAGLGFLVALGLALLLFLSLAAVVLHLLQKKLVLVVFAAYAALAALPAIVFSQSDEHLIFLDLYFVALVTTPAFLSLWSWLFQVPAALLALAAVIIAWIPKWDIEAIPSITLIILASILSASFLLIKSHEGRDASTKLEPGSMTLQRQTANKKLHDNCTNIVFLEAALLAVMLIADFSVGEGANSYFAKLKIYALIAIILASLLLNLRRKKPAAIVSLNTILVGVIVSISRSQYFEQSGIAAAFPLLYLFMLIPVLPLAPEIQVALAWFLLVSDLSCHTALYAAKENALSYSTGLGMLFRARPLELGIVLLSAAASVTAARAFFVYRTSVLSRYLEATRIRSRGEQQPASAVDLSRVPWLRLAKDAAFAEEKKRTVRILSAVALVSAAVSTSLVSTIFVASWPALAAMWLGYTALCLVLVALRKRSELNRFFWPVAAAESLAFLLWPGTLLLMAPPPGVLWLYWPFWCLLAIGFVPWPLKERTSLLLIVLVGGVELIRERHLASLDIVVFCSVALAALALSSRSARLLKEKAFFMSFPADVASCSTALDVLRLTAGYLMTYFNSSSAMCSASADHLELVRDDKIHELTGEVWPLRNLQTAQTTLGVVRKGIKIVGKLGSQYAFFDKRFGFFHSPGGLLFELEGGKQADDPESKAQNLELLIFLPFRYPLLLAAAGGRFSSSTSLLQTAALRLQAIVQAEKFASETEKFAVRSNEREQDLSALVHDINNTVQDLTLLCDSILEDLLPETGDDSELQDELSVHVRRIATIARSVAIIMSDAKRRRELEKMADLEPREMVEVGAVIREVVSFAMLRAGRKRIFVEQPRLPGEELWVKVSVREHLETILRNLLNNSIAYSECGATVRVEVRSDEHWVWIDVIDNGPGLTREERESVFLPGYRGRRAADVPGGLGLGLAESRRVAESAGGRLEVLSAGEGKGCTFTVTLPRKAKPEGAASSSPWALLVDDQPALTEFYSRLAKALDMTPEVAHSVAEAHDVLSRRGKPSFVITDVHLSDSSGLDLVRHLRREFGAALPIVVISGLPDSNVGELARQAGASDFVAKPVGRRTLFARLQSLIPGP